MTNGELKTKLVIASDRIVYFGVAALRSVSV